MVVKPQRSSMTYTNLTHEQEKLGNLHLVTFGQVSYLSQTLAPKLTDSPWIIHKVTFGLGIGQTPNVTQASSKHDSPSQDKATFELSFMTWPKRGAPRPKSINPRETITLTHFYYLIRSGALAGGESETPQGFRASQKKWYRMFFAIIWIVWTSRNEKIFESKNTNAESSWARAKALVNIWSQDRKQQTIKLRIRQEKMVDSKWSWWCCVKFRAESSKYSIGGYLQQMDGTIKCLLGRCCEEKSDGEALIKSLDEMVQFVLEEVGVKEEDLAIIIDNKNIVKWLNDENKIGWQS
ncbi:hypothetical protein PIB30_093675 [Stylosanthes scabra]|uniref:RNase H type-1 domain-containing protein n=1 Tax=Stylosanthes scabra TaxID=79078 RepID=A0ABU6QV51_9FABA|nr:hypothetical protein [Stylosanthes scabra]